MNDNTILIVEDEVNLGLTLKEYLEAMSFNCVWAETGSQAEIYFNELSPSIILMDIGLPDTSGLELARKFRDIRKDFVLLFLSAMNDPDTKVEGLEIGADDYITKPFALKELTLRLNRILEGQKVTHALPEEITFGKLKVWFKRFEIRDGDGKVHPLSQKECGILELLYTKKGLAVKRDEIIEKIWGENKFPSNRTVDNYIVKLRRWCESDPSHPIEIQSIRSVGYKLTLKD